MLDVVEVSCAVVLSHLFGELEGGWGVIAGFGLDSYRLAIESIILTPVAGE